MRFSLLLGILLAPLSLFALQRDTTITLTTSKGGSIHGTLTLPDGKLPAPLVIIIAGSGPTDRDGNQTNLRNNSLRYLADSLAGRGIASLRYDKRGIGASKAAAPDERDLRFDDYVTDAVSWVKQLQKDKRFSKIYIAGHSEGSLIGMLAAQQTSVAGYISIAGASMPADSIVLAQITASPVFPRTVIDSMRMYFKILRRGQLIDDVPTGFYQALLRKSVQPYVISWMKYNPALEIARLKVPVLIIQGTTDLQVDTVNAYALAAAKPDAKLLIIPKMNHVLKESSRDLSENQLTYISPEFALKRELTPAISAFIFPATRHR